MEPSSILELEHLNEDKNYIFSKIGFKYDLSWEYKASQPDDEWAEMESVQKK